MSDHTETEGTHPTSRHQATPVDPARVPTVAELTGIVKDDPAWADEDGAVASGKQSVSDTDQTVRSRMSDRNAAYPKIKSLDDVMGVLGALADADIRYEIEKLRAIRRWAFDQIGIDYAVGDRVRIKKGYQPRQHFADGQRHGWWPYRECLVAGATATVTKIDFNASHGYWYADIVLDREWSVGDNPDTCRFDVRHWHGPADDTPDGMEPPSKFDQEHYPEGRKHTFSFKAEMLERVHNDASEVRSTCDAGEKVGSENE
jgi:hypothetical protein